ncbi:MAG TPA: GAF domain-containing protein [Planctomycetaceae bacterium]|nr:GAF domain-containing protein [Planctomycetaceae bacterium]
MVTSLEKTAVLTPEELADLTSTERDTAVLLSKIVSTVGNHFRTDVCSLYLLNSSTNELVLSATVGLRQDAIGKVRMRPGEGLVGLTAHKQQPVAVKNAPTHPEFKYFPEAGEDRFMSFLGVPVFDSGRFCGVLVVQTIEPREFSQEAVDTLAQAAEMIGPLVNGLVGPS